MLASQEQKYFPVLQVNSLAMLCSSSQPHRATGKAVLFLIVSTEYNWINVMFEYCQYIVRALVLFWDSLTMLPWLSRNIQKNACLCLQGVLGIKGAPSSFVSLIKYFEMRAFLQELVTVDW